MTIKYKCVECGVAMKIKDDLAGQKGKCPKCKASFVIPAPEEETPVEEVPVPDEPEDEFEDDDDDDLDMPMEVTAAPVQAPRDEPPPAMQSAPPRDRKSASETKKATRMSSRPKKPAKKSGGFDPAEFLMEEDDAPAAPAPPAARAAGARPVGRVGGLDEEEVEQGPAKPKSSMSEMFRDFVPAGEKKQIGTGIASTSLAADALARREEQKQKKNSAPDYNPYSQAQEQDEEGTDYAQIAKDLWAQYGLYVGGFLIAFIGIYFVAFSSLASGSDHPPLYSVYGTVTKNGAPVVNADIKFAPADARAPGSDPIMNSGGHEITDAEGEYEVRYNADEWGLPAGKYTVTVTKGMLPLGPPRSIEVKEQSNTINLSF